MGAELPAEAGYRLALEVRGRRRDHVSDPSERPPQAYAPLIDELRRRCPGYRDDEYSRALADGLFNSR